MLLARAGDDVALAEVIGRLRPLVRSKARSYFLAGGDHQDVVQEGMIGLYKAVRDYDHDKHPCFRAFADMCVTRQVLTAVKGATRLKHSPLNAYVPLDGPEEPGDDRPAGAVVVQVDDDPATHVTWQAEVDQLRSYCATVLTDLEADVLTRYVSGESYAVIAEDLGRHVKAVDNAVQRIRRKLGGYLDQRVAAAA
ncbi:RNA polymerase sporulation sigma factor SigH [Euzebya sp.]|uniref:RNA polymerase sporulation sigma factor SigH n=1 Tax=Euzebya sp. TaxID=1971409 RepID=UPI0035170D95